ncbi:MAG: stage 0 sporulation family protein [Pseudomonadota bacterium]
MKKIAGIRFKPAGKIYDFDSGAFVLKKGDHVIVETEQGLGLGFVVNPPRPVDERDINKPLKQIYRIANEDDFQRIEKNSEIEKNAFDYCNEQVKSLGLEMNLFSVESTFDSGKLTFFFTADGRVDFRLLVKQLVKQFRTRIEMRQVGIRNQAKMCGGTGRCGRIICCSSFLAKFEPVSIRMAKEQGLSLNPTKISGQCGRLMCCLTYENETYKTLKKSAPKIGKTVEVEGKKGKIIRQNVIGGTVTMKMEDDDLEIDVKIDEIES